MKLFKIGKRGVFDQLGALGIGVVTLMVVLMVVFLIASQLGSNTTVAADGNATAAVNTLTNAAADIPGWVPIVVIVAIGGLLLLLVRQFRQ